MLETYHDSDSAKDFNPIYYIVNRPQYKDTPNKRKKFIKYGGEFDYTWNLIPSHNI
jgi:hypothetical protein